MLETERYQQLRQEILTRIAADRTLLEQLRMEVRPLRAKVRRIRLRPTRAISLVASDSGMAAVQFDPFLVQVVRVVDSEKTEYCLEVVTPSTLLPRLSAQQFGANGRPCTALGHLMDHLQVRELQELSQMIRYKDDGTATSPSWIQAYRELVEWASLFSLLRTREFDADTLIVRDGLLRSKLFAGDLFGRLLQGIEEVIEHQRRKKKRKIYLVGIAKRSKLLTRYQLVLLLEHILTTNYPAYLEVPPELEERAYLESEYAYDTVSSFHQQQFYAGGKLFFVKFGGGSHDRIWPVDIFLPQKGQAQQILGSLLEDTVAGFPIPHYPLCLQKAHSNAELAEFDYMVLQDQILEGIRAALHEEAPLLDMFRLQEFEAIYSRF